MHTTQQYCLHVFKADMTLNSVPFALGLKCNVFSFEEQSRSYVSYDAEL